MHLQGGPGIVHVTPTLSWPLPLTLYLSSTDWSMCPLLHRKGHGLQTAQCWALPRGFLLSPTLLPQNKIQLVSMWGLT